MTCIAKWYWWYHDTKRLPLHQPPSKSNPLWLVPCVHVKRIVVRVGLSETIATTCLIGIVALCHELMKFCWRSTLTEGYWIFDCLWWQKTSLFSSCLDAPIVCGYGTNRNRISPISNTLLNNVFGIYSRVCEHSCPCLVNIRPYGSQG